MCAYRADLVLGEGFSANPNLSPDEYLAIRIQEGETSQNLWNNLCTPREIHIIYKHRIDNVDKAAN
jgi:hypothetical protein